MSPDYIHTWSDGSTGDHETTGDEASSAPEIFAIPENETGESHANDDMTMPALLIENTDPARRRIVKPFLHGRRGRFAALLREIYRCLTPRTLTKEELILLDEEKQRKVMEDTLSKDAKDAEVKMRNCLDNLKICHYRMDDGRVRVIRSVRFDQPPLGEPDAIHFHVTRQLPWGVSLSQLTDPITLDNLSHAIGKTIHCRYTPETGVWYTIERASGRAGIPDHVMYADLLERMPASSGPLMIPVGYTHNRRPIFADIGRMPHILIGGTTNSGKTNFLHGIITTLIQRNRPDRLQLILVDLKAGVAFGKYSKLPHLLVNDEFNPTGVIEDRDKVFVMLRWLVNVGEERLKMLRAANMEDIGEYNSRKRKSRLPYIVLIIDEWADMMMIDKNEAETTLVNLVSKMRAVGIHVIVSTQTPTSKVITNLIKNNLPCKFAFKVPTNQGSMAILDDASASDLKTVGRAIMQFDKQLQVQTPYIPKETVKGIISAVIEGKVYDINKKHDVTPREVMEWALHENNGWMPVHKTYDQFKARKIPQSELMDWFEQWYGQEFVVDSNLYKVVRVGGQNALRLVPVSDQEGETNGN